MNRSCSTLVVTRAAFTLVELLVVVGIIAVLISLLLPSLNRARAAAASVACLSNMRQISLGLIQYTSQHKGVLVPESYHWDYWTSAETAQMPDSWAGILRSEKHISVPLVSGNFDSGVGAMTEKNILLCPGARDEISDVGFSWYTEGQRGKRTWSGRNQEPGKDNHIDNWYGLNSLGYVDPEDYNSIRPHERYPFRSLRKLAQTEGCDSLAKISRIKRSSEVAAVLDIAGSHGDELRKSLPGAYNDDRAVFERRRYRHPSFGSNIAFLDGHAGTLFADKIATGPFPLDDQDLWRNEFHTEIFNKTGVKFRIDLP
jgi:prepilin-type N-terminal cleavage/methylation domain-containing protein/prepilin-type processing-associated H-X9-DG protein